ncbi:MAG TPA: hypothetical protein VN654_22585 [Vicinamibacterales bacterium]|jgi:hypothetical protein|nr:hypothetical protein [Vicinamibacterales bacterium]
MERESVIRRWAIVMLALVAAAAIGTIAYQAGVSRGIALQPPPAVTAPATPGGAQAAPLPPYPYYPYGYYRPWRVGFFGPLLTILFFVFVLRVIFSGLFGWGWRRRWRYYGYPDDGPSRFDEWHRRAHARMHDDRGPAAPTSV